MPIFKKLIFALPLLIVLIFLYQSINPFLNNIYLIFGFSSEALISLLTLIILLLLTGFFFVLFLTFSQNIWFILPIIVITTVPAFFFIPFPFSLIITLGFTLTFLIIYFSHLKRLKNYLTFSPTSLLLPSISLIITLLLSVISIALYISSDLQIKEQGFKLPESLVDSSLTLAGGDQLLNSEVPAGLPQIDLVKGEMEKQFQAIINPYLSLIPILLAVLFFFSLKWLASLFSPIFFPIVWLLFYFLEQVGFIKFQTEQREVKKLII